MEISAEEIGESIEFFVPTVITVAIGVNGSKNSRNALKWALDKFIPEGSILFRLLLVRPRITMVPTPMGNYIPISQVRDDVASAYRKEMEWQANAVLLPYKKMCAQRQVEAEAVIFEEDDVPNAISEEITKYKICKLVLGASSKNIFTRKIRATKMSSKISVCIPSFCTVYVVSKGKLSSVRSATTVIDELPEERNGSHLSSCSYTSFSSSAHSELSGSDRTVNSSFRQASLSSERKQALANINKFSTRISPSSNSSTKSLSKQTDEGQTSQTSMMSEAQYCSSSRVASYGSFQLDDMAQNIDQPSTSVPVTDQSNSHSQCQAELNFELERLRLKLWHFQKLYDVAQSEFADTSRQLHELGIQHVEEEIKLKEIELREQKARHLARKEREEREAAGREAELIKVSAESTLAQRTAMEKSSTRDGDEKLNFVKDHKHSIDECNRYTWEDIQAATSSFSSDLMIGRGSNGTVYKGRLNHTLAAVKLVHSLEGYGTQQFQQELEVLGKIRHPYLLLMLGACPEHGCLVSEFMENGSLDDRLQRKNDTPPLPWFHRFRIAWEVATALVFLHSSKPEPIIHRDLKPANILLDRNFVSKIGDVGLSTLLPTMNQQQLSTMMKNTTPVGTFCYIDPEYQRTGLLSTKSDIYALGIVILQLLTAKPPVGLTYVVETAIEDGCLIEVLDSSAGHWPLKETRELATLALSCAEMKRKDRPNLSEQVLPTLERFKVIASKARDSARNISSVPSSHFICPILQEVMEDPYVASDGYTYDRQAIEKWLKMNDKSPLTNLKLPSKNIIPNHSLRSAIMDWKSKTC